MEAELDTLALVQALLLVVYVMEITKITKDVTYWMAVISSYTKEDERLILAQRENDNITPTIKFKDLVDNKISSSMVPLQEYVFRQWYYKRIITIGDAAHKVSMI